MDLNFIRRHALFGKSRLRRDRGGPHTLRYGGRKSGKLVRCCDKTEFGAFRIELELHSQLVRSLLISGVEHLHNVTCVYPQHIRFVDVDWDRLQEYLRRQKGYLGQRIFTKARTRRSSIHRLARFLRRMGVPNVHRFFVPLSINEQIEKALFRWVREYRHDVRWGYLR